MSEMFRTYIKRQRVNGCKVIFEWNPREEFNDPYIPDGPYIEVVTFHTQEDAMRFDIGAATEWDTAPTWEDAEQWLSS